MRAAAFTAFAVLVACAGPAAALDLTLPGQAQLVREVDRRADTYFLPTAALTNGAVPSQELEGRIVRQAWQITGEGQSTLGLLTAIRDQVQAQGYEVLLDCAGDECGGFDFRFGIDVLPAPDMFVDLFDFRFLSAQNDAVPGAEHISALVSRAGDVSYIQLVLAGAKGAVTQQTEPVTVAEPAPVPTPVEEPALADEPLAAALESKGHVILPDLVFATGSSTLQEGSYASLSDLASVLKADPTWRVVLVGHTDAVGALDGNVTLSRARATSVMARLVEDYDVDAGQLAAEGMGYLSPVATNSTAEGRRANRRVEAVLLTNE
ncbi:MAG: OmpA family protein [Pseudomonadota bacterium]